MKKHFKIATMRRLVALTMLCALLFSNTAVYADTVSEGETSQTEVVNETGNADSSSSTTSEDSSNDLNDTVSGTDITADTDTTIENNEGTSEETVTLDLSEGEASEESEDADASDEEATDEEGEEAEEEDELEADELELADLLKVSLFRRFGEKNCECDEPSLDKANCDYYADKQNKQHVYYGTCATCGGKAYIREDCTPSGDKRYEKSTCGEHKVFQRCSVCKAEYEMEPEACTADMGDEVYEWYVPDPECDAQHCIFRACTKCGGDVCTGAEECVEGEYAFDECKTNEITSTQNEAGANVYSHTEYAHCKCGREFNKQVECTYEEEYVVDPGQSNKRTKNHTKTRHCAVCGHADQVVEDCDFGDYEYLGKLKMDGTPDFNYEGTTHVLWRTCKACAQRDPKEVGCDWKEKHLGVKYCTTCHNIVDKRSKDLVIDTENVKFFDIKGNEVSKDETITYDGFDHAVFDKQVKIQVPVSCQAYNDKDEDEVCKTMHLTVCYSIGSEDKVIRKTEAMTLVPGSVKDGNAVFEWTSPVPTNYSISVAGIQGEYRFTERYWGFIPNPFDVTGKANVELGYILRTPTPGKYMNNYEYEITGGGNWKQGTTDDTKWYSKKIHNDDLTVTITCTTGNRLKNKTVWLEDKTEKDAKKIYCKSVKNSKTGEDDTQNIEKIEWDKERASYFSHDIYVSYSTEYKFITPADKDGEHNYKLRNTSIEETIDTFIDNTVPTAAIKYGHDFKQKGVNYINKDVPVSVDVTEEHLNYAVEKSYVDIVALKGNELKSQKLENNKFAHTLTADDKYKVKVVLTDLAGNTITYDAEPEFVIDKKAPVLVVDFDNKEFKHEKYYKANRTATFELTDEEVFENLTSAEADMSKVTVKAKGGKATVHSMTGDHCKFKGSIVFDQDGIYQIVAPEFKDKAGNVAVINEKGGDKNYTNEFVIDKTLPEVKVKFDNNSFLNDMYYKDNRTAEITFTEKNFAKDQVILKKTAGDVESIPALDEYKDDSPTHITKLRFEHDGKYGFEIACEDLAGNVSNTVVADTFVIDKTLPELDITGVTNMSANNGAVQPVITAKDLNINDTSTEIRLSGANNGNVNPGLTKSVGTGLFTYSIADLAREKKNDDLYTLSVKLTDFAGNVAEKEVKYSVNRFGSVFVLSDATKAMVDGYYVTSPQDVVITEINVDSLAKKDVSVAFDGSVKELREGNSFTTNDVTNEKGWHSISYKIGKSNFNKDGIYSVNIISEDKASNKQSSQAKDAEVEFLLDQTAPSVVVSGLEDGGVYEEESHDFSVNAVDTIGVTDMNVYLNDEKLASFTSSQLNENGGTAVLTIPAKDDYQKVTVKCTDVAGNVTNLAYNNLLVSVKAEELLLEDNLTPTAKLEDDIPVIGGVKNVKALGIVGAIAAIAVVAGVGAFAFKKKKH